MDQQSNAGPKVGTEVFASDGEKVGEVAAVHPAYLVIERGLIFPDNFYVPHEAVRSEAARLTLSVASGELERQGWNEPPAGVDQDQEAAVFPTGDRVHLDTAEDGTAERS